MKIFSSVFLTVMIICVISPIWAETVQDYIGKAQECEGTGDLEGAVGVMREAVEKYPENPDARAYLGLYLGQSAGETTDFKVQAGLAFESFEVLDGAVSLDSVSVYARFYRGLMGVKVPEFLGKRDQAIRDLKVVIRTHELEPEEVPEEMLLTAYDFLAEVYQERGQTGEAVAAWGKIVELAPESEMAERARGAIAKSSASEAEVEAVGVEVKKVGEPATDPQSADGMLRLGRTWLRSGDYEKAEEVFHKAIALDSSNAQAYALLGMAIAMQAERGYDEEIAENTDFRIDLCFKTMEYLDKAVDLAPDDFEIRLMRGVMGVNFPFFVGKLDQAVADLDRIMESSAPDSVKAEALYHLGVAHRKRGCTEWIKVVTEYPESQAAQWVFESMRPRIDRVDLSKYSVPIVVVDFVLGFDEEIPPQTAVWIENEKGDFVRTLYVSGFSGNVAARQVNLPAWGASSNFETDATTAASIDVGYHTYVWDLRDGSGKKAGRGRYTVKVEVSCWPSMQYQLVSAMIEVGRKENKVKVEEGNVIPLLEVEYLPKGGK